jgi:hypothetical protein
MPSREEAEALIAAIETDSVIGLRDRALIGVLLYIDADVDLIEVPGVARPRPPASRLQGEAPAELQAPAPDALVGDDHAPLGQEQLDVPEAQAEAVVQPDRVADDLAGEAVAAVQVGCLVHPPSLPQPPRSGQGRFP